MATTPPYSYPGSPPTSQADSPGWIARNIKLMIFGVLCVCLLFLATALLTVFGALRHSEVARLTFASAQASPKVTEHLGSPLTMGWFVNGTLQSNGPDGRASLSIPVKGPKGSATLYVRAERDAGTWIYRRMRAVDGAWRADFAPVMPLLRVPGSSGPAAQTPGTRSF